MNYYPHHIGDYLRDTVHLTLVEHGAYRRMLDLYYASEKALPLDLDWLCRLVRADETQERDAVHFVLTHYFVKKADGWHNKRADNELGKNNGRVKAARTNGKKGGRPITQRVISDNPAVTQRVSKNSNSNNPDESSQNQNQNQNQRVGERASRLPPDWVPSELLQAWATKERTDLDLTSVIAKFRDYWSAKPGRSGTKLDWDATFRNWVRDEKPGREPMQKIKVDL